MVSNDIVEFPSDFGEVPSDLKEATTIHDEGYLKIMLYTFTKNLRF